MGNRGFAATHPPLFHRVQAGAGCGGPATISRRTAHGARRRRRCLMKSFRGIFSIKLLEEWRDDIRCVFQRDPAARTTLEVLTTYPGVHAIMAYRVSSRLWRCGWRYLARLLSFVARMARSEEHTSELQSQ